jgi:hypothetical protein
MGTSFKYVIYAALLANLLLIIITVKSPNILLFITAVVSMLSLVVEILLTMKGSLPINDVINAWPANNYPANWTVFRERWFTIFQYRQIASITGFVSLLIGAVFGTK